MKIQKNNGCKIFYKLFKKIPIFCQSLPVFLPSSLDATRTRLNLLVNHRANKRSGWVRVWKRTTFVPWFTAL